MEGGGAARDKHPLRPRAALPHASLLTPAELTLRQALHPRHAPFLPQLHLRDRLHAGVEPRRRRPRRGDVGAAAEQEAAGESLAAEAPSQRETRWLFGPGGRGGRRRGRGASAAAGRDDAGEAAWRTRGALAVCFWGEHRLVPTSAPLPCPRRSTPPPQKKTQPPTAGPQNLRRLRLPIFFDERAWVFPVGAVTHCMITMPYWIW